MAVRIASFLSLLLGAVLVTSVTSGAVSFSKYSLNAGFAGASQMSITLKATTSDSSAGVSGTGLWKMSIFGSKAKNPGDTTDALDEHEQILDQASRDLDVAAGQEYAFTGMADFNLGDMGGCKGDHKYVCVVFSKDDDPQPPFELQQGYSACLDFGFKCAADEEPTPDHQKSVVPSGSSWSIKWGYPISGDETFTFTVNFAENSRQNLAGTGLWKLEVSWSMENNPDSPQDHVEAQSLLTDPTDSGKSLVDGGDLKFTVSTTFSENVGCGDGKYNFVCVAFGKGDNPGSDFELLQSLNYCKDTCN